MRHGVPRRFPILFLASALLLLTEAAALADGGTIVLRQDRGTAGFTGDAGGGGEFGVVRIEGLTPPPMGPGAAVSGYVFQTFCLETNEHAPQDVVLHWTLGTAARLGGDGGAVDGADPLSAEAAYLYTQFWNGTLTGYDYLLGAGRKASALQLQLAIWVLEDEYPEANLADGAQARAWLAEARAATAAGGTWTAQMGANSLGDVRVLTIADAAGEPKQDVLVLVPPSAPPPPPPPDTGDHDARTPGFWANRNGQRLIDAEDLAALRALNLVDARGRPFDPRQRSDLVAWLRGGSARNMAYMLSVQLAAMQLNVREGFVDADAIVYAPHCGDPSVHPSGDFITVAALIQKASAELGLQPSTPSGHPSRELQECLKDALDAANNDANFVEP